MQCVLHLQSCKPATLRGGFYALREQAESTSRNNGWQQRGSYE